MSTTTTEKAAVETARAIYARARTDYVHSLALLLAGRRGP